MEQIRTLRTILAPLVLLASLLYGAWLSGQLSYCVIKEIKSETLTAIGGLIALAILPTGFVIGGISVGLQWIFHKCTRPQRDRFELHMSDEAWNQIWLACGIVESKECKNTRLWAASAWIRSKISLEVRELSERRWHAANAHFNSVVAILGSYAIGYWVLDTLSPLWFAVTVGFILLFSLLSWLAREEGSEMVELLAKTPGVWGKSPREP